MSVSPKVIVFGGCGFIGREIVHGLITDGVAEEVLVVDKVPPQMAWLSPRHQAIFDDQRVTFKSANLINPNSVEAIFDKQYDWAINAAGETKLGLSPSVYDEGITKLTLNCATAAAKHNIKVFLHVSDGRLNSSSKQGLKEKESPQSWCTASACHLAAEERLAEVAALNWAVVRPGLVYGGGDRQGLVRSMVLAAIYRRLGEKLKLLWESSLRLNTIHVTDLARAVVFVCKVETSREVYHVVDEANSTQGSLANIVGRLFQVTPDFYGNIASKIAKMDAEGTVSDANSKHLVPWAGLCSDGAVSNTPLSPYIDQDAIQGGPIHLDGAKLAKLGFRCTVPAPTEENVTQILRELVDLKLFPAVALPDGVLQ